MVRAPRALKGKSGHSKVGEVPSSAIIESARYLGKISLAALLLLTAHFCLSRAGSTEAEIAPGPPEQNKAICSLEEEG